jgi:colicin import membrane protein
MPRNLKTYQTSLGFFDLAIAAPSMKSALEAWNSKANLFHQGFAKEADDPVIIAATMAKPGVVLRRAVGTDANFSEHAEFPKDLPGVEINGTHGKRAPKSPAAPPPRKLNDNVAREAAMAYAREQNRLDRERRRHEAAQEAERNRRSQAVAKAEATLEKAKRTHDTKIEEIAAARSALDRQAKAEENRWDKQRAKLQAALDRARE